ATLSLILRGVAAVAQARQEGRHILDRIVLVVIARLLGIAARVVTIRGRGILIGLLVVGRRCGPIRRRVGQTGGVMTVVVLAVIILAVVVLAIAILILVVAILVLALAIWSLAVVILAVAVLTLALVVLLGVTRILTRILRVARIVGPLRIGLARIERRRV